MTTTNPTTANTTPTTHEDDVEDDDEANDDGHDENDDDNFIETLPFFDSYHLTRLDIWIIATYYKLPIVILYYPSKALIETNDTYSILTTYFEEGVGGSTIQEEESIRRQESSDEDLPFMGEEAQPFPHKKS